MVAVRFAPPARTRDEVGSASRQRPSAVTVGVPSGSAVFIRSIYRRRVSQEIGARWTVAVLVVVHASIPGYASRDRAPTHARVATAACWRRQTKGNRKLYHANEKPSDSRGTGWYQRHATCTRTRSRPIESPASRLIVPREPLASRVPRRSGKRWTHASRQLSLE